MKIEDSFPPNRRFSHPHSSFSKQIHSVMTDGGWPLDTAEDAATSWTVEAIDNQNVQTTHSPCLRFTQYNIDGNIFVLTAKYKPPVKLIGMGTYGIICSAWNSRAKGMVAIKKIEYAFGNQINAKKALREIKLLRHMNHENIIGLKDVIPPLQRVYLNSLHIGFELMDFDLDRVIRSSRAFSDRDYQYIVYQILRGLKYIHSAHVLHRDLKPSNILLNRNFDLKICNFRLACLAYESVVVPEFVESRSYRAPELLLGSPLHTTAIDVWSLGCIFMELLNGKPMFPDKDTHHQLRLIVELIGTPYETEMEFLCEHAKREMQKIPIHPRRPLSARFPSIDPLAIDLVEKMLNFDPRRRIKVEAALDHPYLSPVRDICNEPVSTVPFSFEFEQQELNEQQIKELVYEEALAFNSEFRN